METNHFSRFKPPESIIGSHPRSHRIKYPLSPPLHSPESIHRRRESSSQNEVKPHQTYNQSDYYRSIRKPPPNIHTITDCSPLADRSNNGSPEPTVHREGGATTEVTYLHKTREEKLKTKEANGELTDARTGPMVAVEAHAVGRSDLKRMEVSLSSLLCN
ncbi:hypothetical protein Rs2_35271 [Raphanus sativus]|nr:hypothetical protein Rs2_35271 [Raphanus sativus]